MMISGLTSECDSADFGKAIACGINRDVAPVMGGILLGAALVTLIANETRELPPSDSAEQASAPLREQARVISGADTMPEPPTSDRQLRQLTLQAGLAARAGHCSTVRVIADRVDDLDDAYRRGGFVSDTAIASCL